MSRLELQTTDGSQEVMSQLYNVMNRRMASSPPGLCAVDTALSFLTVCHSQSCGKCAPCRIGLGKLAGLLTRILDGKADEETLQILEETAMVIEDSADCAIGYDSARMVLSSLRAFREDYNEHIKKNRCVGYTINPVTCVGFCPAHVDIPGYIALIAAGRYADAVRLIRKDNPFPVTCGYICEHPCERYCRRSMIDDPINIRGLKRFAADTAGEVPPPQCAEPTGKTVAVIGGGPGGLSAAYYLALMGHKVTVYERRMKLGGMLRYGIPAYRFPREELDKDIDCIVSTGIDVITNCDVGEDISIAELIQNNDSVFISIGAHTSSELEIEGHELEGVFSAVHMLRAIGDNTMPSLKGKKVAVIGGGNVAMDATRTAIRLGAERVNCIYRRRRVDMTALTDEVEGAIAEGVELYTLKAPVRIEGDENGHACAVWVKPQLPGEFDANGRPRPVNSDLPEERIEADLVIVAIGQKIESDIYEMAGIPTNRGMIVAMANGQIFENGKIFAGGDCATNPSTCIRAINAGKVAAANIDEFLGFNHEICADVEVPAADIRNHTRRGRINMTERDSRDRLDDFDCIECGLTEEGARIEANRCLRCDHFGYGSFRGGRELKW